MSSTPSFSSERQVPNFTACRRVARRCEAAALRGHLPIDEQATQVTLNFADWQRVMALQMILARYVRAVTEPEVLDGQTSAKKEQD